MGNTASRRSRQSTRTPPGAQTTNGTQRHVERVMCHICCCHDGEVTIPANERVTPLCTQDRTICVDCLRQHIQQAFAKRHYDNVRCLCTTKTCPATLDSTQIQKYVDKETFEAYNEDVSRLMIRKDPEFCWCSNEGCGSGQLHGDRNRWPIMRCHVCHSNTCFTHHCPWHQGRTCKQYDRDARKSEEVALLQCLENASKFKKCPNCQNGVEKNGGCDHMTCRCKHEFCWLCLAPYGGATGIRKKGPTAHHTTCAYYRTNNTT